MNRGTFRFNEGADRWVIEPVAKGMDFVIPDPVERSIRRFFDNSMIPIHFGNALLQLQARVSLRRPRSLRGQYHHRSRGILRSRHRSGLEAHPRISARPSDTGGFHPAPISYCRCLGRPVRGIPSAWPPIRFRPSIRGSSRFMREFCDHRGPACSIGARSRSTRSRRNAKRLWTIMWRFETPT